MDQPVSIGMNMKGTCKNRQEGWEKGTNATGFKECDTSINECDKGMHWRWRRHYNWIEEGKGSKSLCCFLLLFYCAHNT